MLLLLLLIPHIRSGPKKGYLSPFPWYAVCNLITNSYDIILLLNLEVQYFIFSTYFMECYNCNLFVFILIQIFNTVINFSWFQFQPSDLDWSKTNVQQIMWSSLPRLLNHSSQNKWLRAAIIFALFHCLIIQAIMQLDILYQKI